MASTQADRLMQFSSSAGKDVLLIESLEGAEGISRLFEFQAELLAESGTEIDAVSLVGTKATVTLNLNDAAGARFFNGTIASFEQCAGDSLHDVYRARLVPSMWQLTLSSNCRVFQDQTVVDIVKSVVGDYGLSISDQTTETYEKLDYCTQYSESDFHFVSRLMEENGIFYWFTHSDQDNKINLGDARSVYADCAVSSTIPYALSTSGAEGGYGSWISEFTLTATMVTGQHMTADYNYRNYKAIVADKLPSASPYGKNAFDRYEYPAGEEGYLKKIEAPSAGKIVTGFLKAQLPASDSRAAVYHGSGNARSFCSGYTFTLSNNPRKDWNTKYLLTSVTHHADQVPSYRSSDGGAGTGYSNMFVGINAEIVYKPAITFVKPRIPGPQTAMVVAPSGDEMHIDKLGRINVQFLWDRLRKPNTIDNTWVRVAQQWAGNGWGTYFWPRLNDEVVVMFLNGDPDNPLVVGSVYNGVNVPKYALPDNSTRSGILTRTSKGGGAANANELRFEDKENGEQIFINAERDFDIRTEADHRRFVGKTDSLLVTGNRMEEFDADLHVTVASNQVEKIGANHDIAVGANLTESVGGNHGENISGNQASKVGMNYAMDAGMEAYIKAGMTITIEAGLELTLKAAGGFINIGPAGVAISGPMVLINSGGAAGAGSPGQVESPKTPTKPDKADDGTKGGKL